MKKWQSGLLAVAAVFCLQTAAAAQSVVVDGYGTDERSALKDASRTAVEEVAGTFIDSRTLVENAAVKLDQIYAKSQGFITGTQILAKGTGKRAHARARAHRCRYEPRCTAHEQPQHGHDAQ